MMRSLAEFRRAMKDGTEVDITNHRYPELSGRRRVIHAQTNSIHLTFPLGHAKYSPTSGSWLDFPKSKECQFHADGSITIRFADDPTPFLTLHLVP